MKKAFLNIISLLLVVGNISIFTSCAPEVTPREEAQITIFSTNDIHGSLKNDEKNGIIGVEKLAEIKASTQNAILVDVGDATQGASFASISRGADVITMMNETGYDVMVAGNHEFDYGADVLLQNCENATFPILAANVKRNGQNFLDSYKILEMANYKIGFIGLTTVATATFTNPSLLSGITFEDEVATAKEEIAKIKDETDAIILLTHMGDNSSAVSCTSEKLLSMLTLSEQKEIAAVMDGHSHTKEEKVYTNSDVRIPIIQTGVNFTNLGKVTLNFKDQTEGVQFTSQGEVMDYDEAMNYTIIEEGTSKGEQVSQKLASITSEQNKILNEKLCVLEKPLFGGYICYDYVESRLVETAYGDFVTDAFKEFAEVFKENEKLNFPVVAIENGGGISQSLPTWYSDGTNVTRGDVLNAFNHGNLVEVLKVSPAELFQVIEKGLVTTDQENTGKLVVTKVSGSFIQCSGFSYTYNPSNPTGNKIVEIKLNNGQILQRLDTENKILLATNNYVSSSFQKAEKLGELGGEDILVEDYILKLSQANQGVLDYACSYDRIFIDQDKSPETYDVKIQVLSKETAQKNQEFHLFVDDAESAKSITSDDEGNLSITLSKGAHVLKLAESSNYIYVNNYSGTGVSNTKEGYYRFTFDVEK